MQFIPVLSSIDKFTISYVEGGVLYQIKYLDGVAVVSIHHPNQPVKYRFKTLCRSFAEMRDVEVDDLTPDERNRLIREYSMKGWCAGDLAKIFGISAISVIMILNMLDAKELQKNSIS